MEYILYIMYIILYYIYNFVKLQFSWALLN